MKKWLKIAWFISLLPAHLFAQVIINEIDVDTPGSDALEFIELFDGGSGNISLDGMVLVYFNGSDDQSYSSPVDLDGFSTDANGYFVLGNSNVANVDLIIPDGTLQNGADAVALFTGNATDFPNDTPVTTTNLIDAIVYDTNDANDAGLLILLNPGQPQVNENENGDSDIESLQRIPNGSAIPRNTDTYTALPPTPGDENLTPSPIADLVLTKAAPSNPVFITDEIIYNLNITNNGPEPALNVALVDTLATELTYISIAPDNGNSTFSNGILTVDFGTLAANESVDINLTVMANTSGNIFNRAVISATSDDTNSTNNIAEETVTVFAPNSVSMLINEIDSDTPGTDDLEFIELYDGGIGNTNLADFVVVLYNGNDDEAYNAFDLDGYSTNTNGYFVIGDTAVANVDYQSPISFQNGPDAIVLYLGSASDFPNGTPIKTAGIVDAVVYDTNDDDDTGLLVLLNPGQMQANESSAGSSSNHSLQRIPNGSGGKRNTVTFIAIPPTPGTENFEPPPSADISLTKIDLLDPVFVSDTLTYKLTVTNDGPETAEAVTVSDTLDITTSFLSATAEQGTVNHLNGIVTAVLGDILTASTVGLEINVVTNQVGKITNLAGAVTASTDPDTTNNYAIQQTDVQPLPDTSFVINEIDTDSPGADDLEFIELFDGGRGNISLDGLVLVLFNGLDDQSYRAYDLEGYATNADGYFVLGSAGVVNVDSVVSNAVFQNGPDAVAFYIGNAGDFPNDTPITTNKLIDAVVYGNADSPDSELLTLLNAGQPQVDEDSGGDKDQHSLQRIPNGLGGKRNTANYLAIPPTPGAINVVPPPDPDKADIWVKTSDNPDPVPVGETLEYLITVTNNGPAESDNVELKNTLPETVKFISAVSEQGSCDASEGKVTCNIGNMGNGASVEIKIKVTPNQIGSITNTAQVSSYTVDPNNANNRVSESTTVESAATPDIAVMPKALNFGGVKVSTSLTKTLTIRNVGDAQLDVVSVNLTGTDSNIFAVLNFGSPVSLKSEDTLQLSIQFQPVNEGGKSAQLQIKSNDPDEASKLVQLTGTGLTDSDTLTDYSGIVINEIHFNPATLQGPDNQFEFIELFNTTDEKIPLAGLAFKEGINHTFKAGDTLYSAEYKVLTIDSTSYPGSIEWDSGNLVNGGELLLLTAPDDTTIDSVRYGNSAPWPTASNGNGPSLELIHPSLDNALAENWQASYVEKGTPGEPNSKPDTTAPQITFSATTLDFGEISVDSSAQKTLTITNIGTADLQVTKIVISGADSADWQLSPGNVPFTVLPDSSRALSLIFQPASEGEKITQLIIKSNDGDTPETTIALTGTGIDDDNTRTFFDGIIVINEIHYNPASSQGTDANFEFLELANTMDTAIDLGGVSFIQGITHSFNSGDILQARGFLVLANNSENYPGSIEWDSGNLVNGGEAIELVDKSGNIIDFVEYGSGKPWPTAANGNGPSLELKSPEVDNSDPANWQASAAVGGSPGAANSMNGSSAPQAPRILFPINGETTTVLSWHSAFAPDAGDSLTYSIEVSEQPNFLSLLCIDNFNTDTITTIYDLKPAGVLQAGIVYFWRVKVNGTHGLSSGFSTTGRFKIAAPTGVSYSGNNIPEVFSLQQNYPNPFNPETIITYDLPEAAKVTILIYDVQGRKVMTLEENEYKQAGSFSITWSGQNDAQQVLSSGMYFYRISIKTEKGVHHSFTRKMVFLK